MRVRLLDVADHAGVSKATASLVLNGKAQAIGSATILRVETAAEELGYRPNVVAQNLREQRSRTIAILSDQVVTTPYAGAMIEGAQQVADDHGYSLLLSNIVSSTPTVERAINTMLDRQVDAVIYATMYHRTVEFPAALRNVPTVMLNARPDDPNRCSWVVPDETGGATAAVEHLVAAGHRDIGFIDDVDAPIAAVERRAAFEAVLREHGLEVRPGWIAAGQSDTVGGRTAAETILAAPERPTAIFAFNDRMAAGAAHAARSHGLSIPEDLSIVGFDNQVLIAEAIDPPLTTVRLPHLEMGRWAMEQALTLLDEQAGPQLRRMPCPLVERGSVAPPTTNHTTRSKGRK